MTRQKGFAPIVLVIIGLAILVGIGIGYILPRYQLVRKEQMMPEQKTDVERESQMTGEDTPTASPTKPVTVSEEGAMMEAQTAPTLSQNAALQLANSVLGNCGCTSRSVSVSQQNGTWYITVMDNGLQDDSIKAKRVYASVSYQNGKWIMGSQSVTYQCAPGRGHENFSSAYCE